MAVPADETNLSGGVFIMHCPPTLQYTPQSLEEWCSSYWDEYAIGSCEGQSPLIPDTTRTVWYILSAWSEDKIWFGNAFGFGDYDPDIFTFTGSVACCPGQLIEYSSPSWPGPNSGTSFVSGDTGWAGNFVPVYCFTGYGYAEGMIPLVPDPYHGYVGWSDFEGDWYMAVCLPSLGILTDGVPCCPDDPTPSENVTWGEMKATYR